MAAVAGAALVDVVDLLVGGAVGLPAAGEFLPGVGLTFGAAAILAFGDEFVEQVDDLLGHAPAVALGELAEAFEQLLGDVLDGQRGPGGRPGGGV